MDEEFTQSLTTVYSGPSHLTLSLSDIGLSAFTSYHYRIKAKGEGFADSAYSTISVTTQGTSLFDIQLTDFDNNVIHEDNDLDSMIAFLNSYSITKNLILQFNTNNTYQLSNTWFINLSNGNHRVKITSKVGVRATIDVQNLAHTVVSIGTSNIDLYNLRLINADPNNISGTIVRLSGADNCSFGDLILDRGYCGFRGTNGLTSLNFANITIRSVVAGAFRLGDGALAFPDVSDITINTITMEDPTNGGTIPGTTSVFSPFILIKKGSVVQR